MNTVSLTLDITDAQAWALAQFVKRVGWVDFRQNASSDYEAHRIGNAVAKLQRALADNGYNPR